MISVPRLPGKKWLCIAPGRKLGSKNLAGGKIRDGEPGNLGGEFDALVLLGNAADNLQAQQVARRAGLPCINLCGRTSLLQAAAVMAQMALFIGNDSGPRPRGRGRQHPVIHPVRSGPPGTLPPLGRSRRLAYRCRP